MRKPIIGSASDAIDHNEHCNNCRCPRWKHKHDAQCQNLACSCNRFRSKPQEDSTHA